MFGSLGVPELILIFMVILIVFGPRRIPEIGRTLGKALGEFRRATDDLKNTIDREVRLEELKKITPSFTAPFDTVSRTEPQPFSSPSPDAAAPGDSTVADEAGSGQTEPEPPATTDAEAAKGNA